MNTALTRNTRSADTTMMGITRLRTSTPALRLRDDDMTKLLASFIVRSATLLTAQYSCCSTVLRPCVSSTFRSKTPSSAARNFGPNSISSRPTASDVGATSPEKWSSPKTCKFVSA